MYLTYSPKYFARKDYDGRFSPKAQLSAINQKTFEHDCKKIFEGSILSQKVWCYSNSAKYLIMDNS